MFRMVAIGEINKRRIKTGTADSKMPLLGVVVFKSSLWYGKGSCNCWTSFFYLNMPYPLRMSFYCRYLHDVQARSANFLCDVDVGDSVLNLKI